MRDKKDINAGKPNDGKTDGAAEKLSDTIENAHASGDGAIGQHDDTLLEPGGADEEAANDKITKEGETY